MTTSSAPRDHLDGWVEWCRSRVLRKRPDPMASLILALIWEVRRLRGQA